MKPFASIILLGLSSVFLAGCPLVFSDCFDDSDCDSGYYCDNSGWCERDTCSPDRPGCSWDNTGAYSGEGGYSGGGYSGGSNGWCRSPADCAPNETCGEDGYCHPGDCFFWGCIDGYSCQLGSYGYECVADHSGSGGYSGGGSGGYAGDAGGWAGAAGMGASSGNAGAAGTGASSGNAGAAGTGGNVPIPINCGNPADCEANEYCSADGVCKPGQCKADDCVNGYECVNEVCVPEDVDACILDADCVSFGQDYKCINGTCTAPADQCTDKTQCPDPANQRCVDGKCIAACKKASDCPDGYSCDTTLGVCVAPSSGCKTTNDCGDANQVCVAGACVDKCGPNGKCEEGFVCVANGCVPDEAPAFICDIEGAQDACAKGSICLHHSCYITCTPEPNSCEANPANLNQCKDVVTSAGTFNVCGSSTNLGNQCDPTAGKTCTAGKVCIDGFCR